ncbi:integrase core domain-containing protein [Flavobacterium sp. CFBP9031]|jgi:Transposase and inactivated derivatives|uniref:integrase core domain-containing protein n=1 Tax=Flavobacterium sp. CFBP9031 TaxID=3096538 RepID=UPI002A6B78F2|nr:integrase core domain-containing protein [Flavobacterium sp. CFBP9031]MDY0988008.1 integrase core domain-containing protein [Flavobacterium sp. CFBP9031]
MRNNSHDSTLERNYLEKYRFLIKEYEQVKNKTHPVHKKAMEFYKANDTCRKSFLKYYNRYKQSGKSLDLLPQKRGPKYKTRRPVPFIERKVIELREKGNNKYEIVSILKPKLGRSTPSYSGVYNILKRNNINRLTPKIKKNHQKIIKERMGQLGHIDCHHLSKSIIKGENRRLYLVCIIDDYSRIAWAELIPDITSLTVMFAALKCLNILSDHYEIKFEEILSDNGPEFGIKTSQQKYNHPFERMLMELGIIHRHTKPYRPQTNGKVERFWRTLEDDLLRETDFDSLEELKEELLQYLYYYNHERPHQGIDGKKPIEMINPLPK